MLSETIVPPKTRAQELRSYDPADFPALTGREEEWRFTPLKRLLGLADGDAAVAAAGPRHEYGQNLPGVTVGVLAKGDPRFGATLVPFDRPSAVAYAGADKALLVEIGREAVPAEPVTVRIVGGGVDGVAYGHTVIDVGPLAEVSVILEQSGPAVLGDNVEVLVADSARLTLVTVADWDTGSVQAQHVKFRLGRDSKVTHVQVTLGGDLVRQYTSAEYTGRGGDFESFGLYFADAGQHQEHRLLVDHTVPDCRSHVTYRGALQGEGAHTVWVGDVLIRAEATGTDTYEINRNLILTDGARADSIPNLEIETGEVAGAGHASATGRFDDEHLFYLMSRGITEEEARRLVVRGFFAELLAKIPAEDLRERLSAVIDTRLTAVGE
ncbi:Fe-S cluster assembly protein SufD [Longispora sp. NPDC051575]|uniref:Fe-S cluster assembly protein SufD n=1 Tax=Longispora sp. NPDC051575 TaxID=3154943 RepID=UPI00343375B0